MTRIVAGEFGGRVLRIPKDRRVRPTAERAREAWFSILGDRVVGARVLDLFAGSGALGLEALSRGAREATFVDVGRASLDTIRANVESLGVADRVRIVRGDALRFVEPLADEPVRFDLALADPPYDLGLAEQLAERFLRAPFAGLLAIEHLARQPLAGGGDSRRYGDTAVTFFTRP